MKSTLLIIESVSALILMGCTLQNVRRGGVGEFVCVLSLITQNRRARGYAVKYKCLRSIDIVNHAAQLQRVLYRLLGPS